MIFELVLLMLSGLFLLIWAGILFCVYVASILVVATGWYWRKRWLMYVGAIPFGLLTLGWILFCLMFYG
ncbi:MAG TPA: hypothetical protein VMB21_01120 [Candidatus Limnocylindria bacterium]|jgi:hypothetical protein|nr:hypothetical protein [Candidatus Limnocylindria bacterium]